MRKFLKLFNLVCLLLVISAFNCSAISDYRFVKNPTLIESTKRQIDDLNLSAKYGLLEKVVADYGSIVFAVSNYKNNSFVLYIPVLTPLKGIVGEVKIEIIIESAKSTDDILNELCSTSILEEEIQIITVSTNFLESINKLKYIAVWDFISRFGSIIEDKQDSKIYYKVLADHCSIESFSNIYVNYEYRHNKKDIMVSKVFIFERSGELKPFIQRSPINFFENLLSKFREPSHKKQGYELLAENSAKDTKLKLE